MKRTLFFLLGLFLLAIILFIVWPSPIDAVAWQPPKAPALTGVYEKNNQLANVEILFEGQCNQCEDVAIDSIGRIYGGQINGDIIEFANGKRRVIANTGGRPLGLHFDQQKQLIIADAVAGLLSLNISTGKLTTLVDSYEGEKMIFVDDVEIAKDGTIYFSDASTKWGFGYSNSDVLEGRGNGRFYAYYPDTKQTKLLLDDLRFANGIAVAHDQSYVLINETGRYRTQRYWLKGPKKGQADIFIENLPGFPDGISQGSDGLFWIALVTPRQADLDKISSKPFIKNLIAKLPHALQPGITRYGFILAVDGDGQIQYNFQDPAGKFAVITSVQQFGNTLYLGSLHEQSIAKFVFNQ